MKPLYFERQTLFDADENPIAVRWALHGWAAFSDAVTDQTKASEQALAWLAQLEKDIGWAQVVGDLPLWWALPTALLRQVTLPAFAHPGRLIIEITPEVAHDVRLLKRLKHWRTQGHYLALARFEGTPEQKKVLPVVHWARLPLSGLSQAQLAKAKETVSESQATPVAVGVDTPEQFQAVLDAGVTQVQGLFWQVPKTQPDYEPGVDHRALRALSEQMQAPGANFDPLSRLISQVPSLAFKLVLSLSDLAQAHHLALDDLNQALHYTGMGHLTDLVTQVEALPEDCTNPDLLITALARARFCEQAAFVMHLPDQKDEFFLAGLFSLLGAYLRQPLSKLLDALVLSDAIKQALLHQAGLLGQVLGWCEAFEQGRPPQTEVTQFEQDTMGLSRLYLAAYAWAYKIEHTPTDNTSVAE